MQVGDYVRTKKGFIGKANVITQYNVNIEDKKIVQLINITKSSPNIIDLIEVGDYVNGKCVDEIDTHRKCLYSYERDDYYIFNERDIKSIVTKENFKEMEYKI